MPSLVKSVVLFWESVLEEDGEVVEGVFPFGDRLRPFLRRFVDRHVDQQDLRITGAISVLSTKGIYYLLANCLQS